MKARISGGWILAALVVLGCSGSSSTQPDTSLLPGDLAVDESPDGAVEDLPAEDALEPVDMGPDAPPCFQTTSPWGFQDLCDGTVLDTRTRLVWEKVHSFASGLIEARSLCEASQTGGLEDWRLPTIDELRTLILGCEKTMPTGACPVHDANGICEDKTKATCWTEDCRGCGIGGGPVSSPADPNRKCYQDATFQWQCSLAYLSDTQVQARSPSDRRSWFVTFYDAGIDVPPSMSDTNWAVRCVRGPVP
ncbi:MAG TPA: DUF1566 domain-containing protein [Myxococcota bacterium]|nr:DUF1566 domain-containing protein [Myxococcota bacterium]HQK50018.1 DUF1566 domain-containing protein [Myxococcota bacterium]